MQKSFLQTLILGIVFILPWFFWTLTPNIFEPSKQLLVIIAMTLVLLSYTLKVYREKSLTYSQSSLTTPIIIFILSISASLIFNPEGRPEALAGKAMILLLLPLTTLILTQSSGLKLSKKSLLTTLACSSSLLAVHSLLQFTIMPSLVFLPSFLQSKTFTPTGDYLTTLTLIIAGIFSGVELLKTSNNRSKILHLVALTANIMGVVSILALMTPSSILALQLIPYKESWSITLDALKSLKSILVGVGISNYPLLYNLVKPLSLNSGNLWNLIPNTGTSELLTIFATSGMIAGISLVWLFIVGLKNSYNSTLFYPLSILILSIIFLPGSIVIYFLFFIFLAYSVKNETQAITLKSSQSSIFSLVMASLTLIMAISFLRPIISEYFMNLANISLRKNDGKPTYDHALQAIKFYPRMAAYHIAFAEINLNLASAMSQKSELSDEEKNTIPQLIQQAIKEAKIASNLRPNYSYPWIILAKVYTNLIGISEEAGSFAIENYARAVSLDPANPITRTEFGGLFYQLGLTAKTDEEKKVYFERSKSEFQIAIQLKNDFAPSYYNLSKLLESTGDIPSAISSMEKAISLLEPTSPDLARANEELKALKLK